MILGREAELAHLARFIDSIEHGPSACILEGSPGIGKTTLWLAGLDAARRIRAGRTGRSATSSTTIPAGIAGWRGR